MPGGISVSELKVYESVAPDGLRGGSPHMHLVASEAYLVVSGTGEIHSIDADGWRVTELAPGDTVWFEPGVIHRAVNRDRLHLRVVMSHAGLPEAGDAVMTFSDSVLADPERYAAAAVLPGADAPDSERLAAAERRRDQAVAGYQDLFQAGRPGVVDDVALAAFRRRAVDLVAGRAEEWRRIHDATTGRAASTALGYLEHLVNRDASYLDHGRIARAATTPAYGMCGTLVTVTKEGLS